MREKDLAKYTKLVGTTNGFSIASSAANSSFMIAPPSSVSKYPKIVSKNSSISLISEDVGTMTPNRIKI